MVNQSTIVQEQEERIRGLNDKEKFFGLSLA
jgi:hypothetical protein